MPEPTLGELQQRFADGLLDGTDAPVALFRGPAELVARRIALYRGNLLANWSNALGNAFPVIRALVGEDFFRGLARSYGRTHAFAEGDLNRFGAAFPDFLADFGPARSLPYLADVGRLEWAIHVAHYAASTPALDGAALAAIAPGRLAELSLRLRPGVAMLASPWAVGRIWLAHQPGAERGLPDDPAGESRLLVFRPRWRVESRELAPAEFLALSALAAGDPLGSALERAAACDERFDPAEILPRWLADALFQPPEY